MTSPARQSDVPSMHPRERRLREDMAYATGLLRGACDPARWIRNRDGGRDVLIPEEVLERLLATLECCESVPVEPDRKENHDG